MRVEHFQELGLSGLLNPFTKEAMLNLQVIIGELPSFPL